MDAKPIRYTGVRVTWRDSIILEFQWRSVNFYKDRAKELGAIEHSTVGYLVDENDDYVLVSLCMRPDGAMMEAITIPRLAIIEMVELEIGRKREWSGKNETN